MTMLTSLENVGIGDAGVLGLLGYVIVFVGLIALMIVVILVGKFFTAKKTDSKKAAPVSEPAPADSTAVTVVEESAAPVAPGTAGQLKIYDVPPKTAAMLMAIVANKMDKPLNELRFISIKEVK